MYICIETICIMYLATNLLFLRERAEMSRQRFADIMNIGQGAYAQYEHRGSVPPMEVLMKIADFYRISIDDLLRKNLSGMTANELEDILHHHLKTALGTNLRILPVMIGSDNKDNVELVPVKAKAGYISGGFEDPVFISELSQFRLPMLPDTKKFRMFQIQGDSMHPIPSGAYVLGAYVENWFDIKEMNSYILITKEDIVFKTVSSKPSEKAEVPLLTLSSLNELYDPYNLPLEEVREIWEFQLFMSTKMPEPESLGVIFQELKGLRREIEAKK